MNLPKTPTIFDLCRPRADVLDGKLADADFAADLARVLTGNAAREYREPAAFFANTFPTRGLKNLLSNVCGRLSGANASVGSIFRLDTSYGGGKTHGLIALAHAARGMTGVANISEFIDTAQLPRGPVRVAAFDGENADPMSGRALGGGVVAYTPWGEIAHALAGNAGYERIRRSDEGRAAPGAETLRSLFGGEPTLILLDELSVYLRKVQQIPEARGQLTAFLTSLFKAVEGTANAAVVYTLAIGKDGAATDAYSAENEFISTSMEEIESVSARQATLLNPTEEDETVQVLRRRLFESIDENGAAGVVETYRDIWASHQETLAREAGLPETVDQFRASYPLHPHVLETLTGKTATISTFQRVRGMLRLLARTIAQLWNQRPSDATAIHLHHIDPGYEPIRQEIVTRLGQDAFVPAITNDVAAGRAEQRALAEEIDVQQHQGMPPYAAYVARTIFMHTLAFNDRLKGATAKELRYAVTGPAVDLSFVDEARKRFTTESAYLDDRPGAPLRFLAEANLNVIIRREEQYVDAGEARSDLKDNIRRIFDGKTFELVLFPGGAFDVPDEIGDGRPKLVVFSYDGLAVGDTISEIPVLVDQVYSRRGAEGAALRTLRNHLVFVVADEGATETMRQRMRTRLALKRLKAPDRLIDLAEHQQEKIREREEQSEQQLAIAIQQCYRHVFYPSRNRTGSRNIELEHEAVDMPAAANRPGTGQQQVARALRELKKLRYREDEQNSPTYVRDQTPLRKGEITTLALREEFRRNPSLPMLLHDDILIRGIRKGIDEGTYVYKHGDLLFGPGDPAADIRIDEQSVVMRLDYAKNTGIWPRAERKPDRGEGAEPERESDHSGQPKPPAPAPPAPAGNSFTAEGLVKEALTQLWEKARAQKVEAIGTLRIRMFEASDAFRMLSAVRTVSSAKKTMEMTGNYETGDGSTLELKFRGSTEEAGPVKEFLEPQLRVAPTTEVRVIFELAFTDGLEMKGASAETFTNGLCRFARGAAHVAATAEAQR